MSDLASRLLSAIQERKALAEAASQSDRGTMAGGEHWHWECGNCDQAFDLNPVTVLDELMECPNCESGEFALRSVEQYPTRSVGPLPHFVVNYAQELRPVDAWFIAANSPAVVLRQVERDERVLARHRPYWFTLGGVHCTTCGFRVEPELAWPCAEIADLAHAYAIPTEDGEA